MVVPIGGRVPDPADAADPVRRDGIEYIGVDLLDFQRDHIASLR
jgi:hypothetical protein